MSRIERAPSSRTSAAAIAPSAWRIRFVSDAPPDARIIRQFTDPSPMFAVVDAMSLSDLPGKAPWPESTDQLLVIHVANTNSSSQINSDWLTPPANAQAPIALDLPLKNARIRWRPGRALIEGKIPSQDEVLCALAEFAFHEGQLRGLEDSVTQIEATAPADVPRAFEVRSGDKSHWTRLRETIERLATLRLTAARLEPRLYLRPRTLQPASQNIVRRLCTRADTEARLESLSDRLEACEDLYEGAVDRITDHRWYRKGMWIEIAIVVLLFLEVIQFAATMMLHGLPGK